MRMVKFPVNMYRLCLVMSCVLFVGNAYSMQIVRKTPFDDQQLVYHKVTDCFGEEYPLNIAANTQPWGVVQFLCEQDADKGVREAFDHAKYIRRFRVNDLRANKGNIRAGLIPSSREEFIAEVKEIEAIMKFLLLKNKNFLLNEDVKEAIDQKDKNLLRLYCECDKWIDASRISEKYPGMLESPEIW